MEVTQVKGMSFRFGECQHPFYSMKAYAVYQTDPRPDGTTDFKIHFRCERCGKELVLHSKAHKATEEERNKMESRNEENKNPDPGTG